MWLVCGVAFVEVEMKKEGEDEKAISDPGWRSCTRPFTGDNDYL
jgi:hypothetical protein